MKHISELLTDYAAGVCERVTGRTVDEWAQIKAERLREAVATRKIEIGKLYASEQITAMHRWYGLPLNAFEGVQVKIEDVMLTGLERTASDAWENRTHGKTPTVQVDRWGRSKPMMVLGPLETVIRYRLARLDEGRPKPRSAHDQLPPGDRN